MIRKVKLSDAAAIAKIYNHYIKETIITFETEPISQEEMEKRLIQQESKFPWIVLEENGEVKGYAYASAWKSRCAYNNSVESTIYLDPNYLERGAGTRLYQKLIALLEEQGIHAIIGGIALPNERSIRLHEKLGFEKVAQFKEVGFKFEKWIDVGYWQRLCT